MSAPATNSVALPIKFERVVAIPAYCSPVLGTLVGQDTFYCLLLSNRHILADVFSVRLYIEGHELVVHPGHRDQFIPPHALHSQNGLVSCVFMKGADDMDGQLVFATM